MALGYERTELGPTTNFVGNHMTQGAIDLVQADLDEIPMPSFPLLTDAPASGPLLISSAHVADSLALRAPKLQQIEHYGWEEHQGTVRLSIQLVIPSAAAASACLDGAFSDQDFWLALQHCAPDGAPGIRHILTLPRLFGHIIPEQSHMNIAQMVPEHDYRAAAAPMAEEADGAADRPQSMVVHTAQSSSSSMLVMVLLAKRDPQQSWPTLSHTLPTKAISRYSLRLIDTAPS